MKTFEERAKDFSPDAINLDEILPVRAGHIVEKKGAHIELVQKSRGRLIFSRFVSGFVRLA